MKIVIDIPEEIYKFIKDSQFFSSGRRSGRTIEQNVINAIKNGKPLPNITDEQITEAMNLISRNKSVFQYDEGMTKALNLAIKALEERPQGEWIEGKKGNIKCNQCGCEIRYSYLIGNKPDYPKFCCDCGAEMKGGAEE